MTIDKTLPHSSDIELSVLGGMMIDNEAVTEAMTIITEDVFYHPQNSIIFSTICKMHIEGKPIDVLTLCEQLEADGKLDIVGGEAHIAGLYSKATTSANVSYHCEILLEKANLRKLISLSKAIEQHSYDFNAKAENIAHSIINHTFGILSKIKTCKPEYKNSLVNVSDELAQIIEHGDKLKGISTGYQRLDDMIDGLQAGDLIIIAGRPEVGKTSYALNIALNIAKHDIPVGFFSLEMPLNRVTTRLIQIEARQDLSRIGRKQLKRENADYISDACNRLYSLPIYIDDTAGYNHVGIYARMEQFKRQNDVKVFFIDHLQHMVGTPEFRSNRRLQIEDITRHMKMYAKQLNMPIVMVSHLSRESDKQKRSPILSDLRESGMIEADADIVMFIHHPPVDDIIKTMSKIGKYYTEDEANHIKELIIRKNRYGATGTIYFHWQPIWTRFEILDY